MVGDMLFSLSLSLLNLTVNLCIVSFVLSLALRPHLPLSPDTPIVPLPGSWLWSLPTTSDLTFLSLSQRPCVAEPETTFPSSAESHALRSLILLSVSPSPPLNLSPLPQTSPRPLLLVHTKLPKAPSSLWNGFSFTHFQSFMVCTPFLPSGRHLLLFSSICWENLSALLFPSGLSLSPLASQNFLNAFFYRVYSSFCNLTSFTLLARSVSVLDGQLSNELFLFLSSFRMGLTNSSEALGQFLLRSTSLKVSILSGTPPFSTNLFRFAFLLVLNLYFLIGVLAWFISITKVASFESVEVFRKDPFLALHFSLFASMIFRLLYLPSAALFMLTI